MGRGSVGRRKRRKADPVVLLVVGDQVDHRTLEYDLRPEQVCVPPRETAGVMGLDHQMRELCRTDHERPPSVRTALNGGPANYGTGRSQRRTYDKI